MMLRVRVESDAASFEDLFNHSLLLQPVESVVNGRARSHREFVVDRLQNLIGCRVMMRRLHIINYGAPLRVSFSARAIAPSIQLFVLVIFPPAVRLNQVEILSSR